MVMESTDPDIYVCHLHIRCGVRSEGLGAVTVMLKHKHTHKPKKKTTQKRGAA